MHTQTIATICGSLRSDSLNRTIINTLPELAPDGMTFAGTPSFGEFPHYNTDLQNSDRGHCTWGGNPCGRWHYHRLARILPFHSRCAEERDRLGFTKPEVFVTFGAKKVENGKLIDEAARAVISGQLATFATFAARFK